MSSKHKGRSAPGRFSFSNSLNVLALTAVAVFVNFAIPQDAQSQISSHVIAAPFSSSGTHHSAEVRQPRAPVQVEMPAPPPMKYFPGLAEPLVATGPVTDEEGKDLDAALAAFHDAPAKAGKDGDFSDYSMPLLAFIAAHPNSNWNAALHTNLGFGFYHDGYYSHAFTEFGQAWKLGRNATSPQAHMMIDRAVGELALMHSRVGHKNELDEVLNEIGNRPIGGPATETLNIAHKAQSSFHGAPEISFLCGPKALRNVLKTLKASRKQIHIADKAKSGTHGYSLPQLAALATKAGLKYKLIHREPGQPVPVPSIINWNVHHYAAVLDERDGRYHVADPTFGYGDGGGVLTAKAIDAESSGYFLVPAKVMAANPRAGWRIVSAKSDEAKSVYGMGVSTGPWPGQCMNCDSPPPSPEDTTCPVCNTTTGPISPMTIASGTAATVSLHLQDQPVGYKPQVGKIPNFERLTYNQREDLQPANFQFSNVSSKWSHNWMAYITYNPTSYGGGLYRNAGGGGGFYVDGIWHTSSGQYPGETIDLSDIFVSPVGSAAASFTRYLPDGSTELYDTSNGATTFPAYMFLHKVTDPQGNMTTLTWTQITGTQQYRLTSVTDPMGRSTTYTYGLSGYPLLITKITDPFGRTAQFTYDTSQRLSTITDPVGITSTFTYSTTDTTFVNSLTTPYGTSTFSEAVNPNDHPWSGSVSNSLTLTDPLGYMEYFYYYQPDSSHEVTPVEDPADTIPAGMVNGDSGIANANLSWRNTYHWSKHQWGACLTDPTNACTISSGVVTNENFNYPSLTHYYHMAQFTDTQDKARQISSIKQPLENRVWFNQAGTYDGTWSGTLDRPYQVGRVLDGDATTQLTTTIYNFWPGGSYTAYPWPLSITDPIGRYTTYSYASNNLDLLTVKQWIGGSSYSTIATYGSYVNHRPQTYTGADGQTWNYTYNTAGQIKTVTDPNSDVTTYNYDSVGRLSTIVNANSQTVLTNTYDSADRIQTQTDSQGYTLTYAYDNIDRITQITYPDGTTDLYDYTFQSGSYVGTASLELRKYTDRLGRVTTYNYDADQRLTSVTEPITATTTRTTSYDYYEDGTLKDIIDANGNDTRWTIDIESRPTSKTYAYGTAAAQTETYTWESSGGARLHSITDALGQVKTFAYALDDRITGITYTSTVNTTPNVTFTWDTYFPRLTKMTDGLGTTNYSYTAVGTNGALKLSGITGPFGTNGNLSLTYDAIGRLSGRTIAGGNETLGYDAINRLTSHGTPLGSFTIGYLGQTNQVTSQSVTNGSTTVSTNWGYDTNTNDRRLISITNSGVTRNYTIGYGSGPTNVYDIQSITDTAATGHPWATQSHSYTNDMIDRLLTASSTTPGNFSYGYDPLDNPTTVTTPSGTVTPAPTFNGLNQIHTWGSNTYSFDADGNTLSGDGTRTYKWDAENRLIEIDYVGSTAKSNFSYDGLGHRMVDVETASGGGTTTTRYLWCSGFICQTRDGSDNVLRRDLKEGEYNVSTSQKLIYMADQLGSVRDVLDASTGNLVQSYDYTPYGAVARSNGSTPTDNQFTGLFTHPASGLNLATFRALDGSTGRWINRDPIREFGGFNLYGYVDANPINEIDLDGLCGDVTPLPQKIVSCGRAKELCLQAGYNFTACLQPYARCLKGLGNVEFPGGYIGNNNPPANDNDPTPYSPQPIPPAPKPSPGWIVPIIWWILLPKPA